MRTRSLGTKCDLLRSTQAIGCQAPDFAFAAEVAQRKNCFAIGTEFAFAAAPLVALIELSTAQRAYTLRGQLATAGQQHPLAIGCHRGFGQKLLRLFHPAGALVVKVAAQSNGDALAVAGCGCFQVQQINISTHRHTDARTTHRGVANIPALEAAVLAQVPSIGSHRPHIDCAIAVRQEGHPLARRTAVGHRP